MANGEWRLAKLEKNGGHFEIGLPRRTSNTFVLARTTRLPFQIIIPNEKEAGRKEDRKLRGGRRVIRA
jgi:hypothetical protein